MKRLLCVDDSPDMLEILVDLLQPQFTIVGTLSSGASVLEEATTLNPDIILLDVDLGDISGFAVAEKLSSSGCPARVVFLSVHESIEFIRAAKDLGAAGYVCKSQITRDLVKDPSGRLPAAGRSDTAYLAPPVANRSRLPACNDAVNPNAHQELSILQ